MADFVLPRLEPRSSDGKKHVDKSILCSSYSKQRLSVSNPLSNIIRGTNNLVLSLRDGLTESEREERSRTEERKAILKARILNVSAHCVVFEDLIKPQS